MSIYIFANTWTWTSLYSFWLKSNIRQCVPLFSSCCWATNVTTDIKVLVTWLWTLIWSKRTSVFPCVCKLLINFVAFFFNEEHIVYHSKHILIFFFISNIKMRSVKMFLGDKKSERYQSFNHVYPKCLRLLWVLSGILHDLHILAGTKARFKPAVTCLMVLVGLRTSTETCTLMC